MKRFLGLALVVAALWGLTPTVANAGQWQQQAGYWYYQDDAGNWFYQDGGNWYQWSNGQWEFYPPWSTSYGQPADDGPYTYGYSDGYSYGYAYPYYGYRTYRPGIGFGLRFNGRDGFGGGRGWGGGGGRGGGGRGGRR